MLPIRPAVSGAVLYVGFGAVAYGSPWTNNVHEPEEGMNGACTWLVMHPTSTEYTAKVFTRRTESMNHGRLPLRSLPGGAPCRLDALYQPVCPREASIQASSPLSKKTAPHGNLFVRWTSGPGRNLGLRRPTRPAAVDSPWTGLGRAAPVPLLSANFCLAFCEENPGVDWCHAEGVCIAHALFPVPHKWHGMAHRRNLNAAFDLAVGLSDGYPV